MVDVNARKRLFSDHKHRRRPLVMQGARSRLLGGQALAQAQRLSTASLRPTILGYAQFFLDMLALGVTGMVTLTFVSLPVLTPLQEAGIVWLAALMAGLAVRIMGGYGFRSMRNPFESIFVSLLGLVLALLAVRGMLIHAGLPSGRVDPWLLIWLAAVSGILIAVRLAMSLLMKRLIMAGRLEHRIVVVGGGECLEALIREIDKERGKGRRLCGFFDERSEPGRRPTVAGHYQMGDIDDLVEFARLAKIDTVIVAIEGASSDRMRQLLARLFVLPVDIRVLEGADVPEFSRKKRSKIGPFKLIEIYKRPLDGFKEAQKRVFDVFFASIALVMFLPLMGFIGLLIKLESRGPMLFQQKRHGYNNKPINVLKFRSMYADKCDPTAVKQVRKGDARVTRIGRFIRRASIDELPQFWNVIKGDLSLVGPRPHALSARTGDFIYDEVTAAYSARHKVKPGVTGWAQINGWRGEMNSPEKIEKRVEHDLYYIENWSLWLDFKILMLTPYSLVATKNAY